jgi:transposase
MDNHNYMYLCIYRQISRLVHSNLLIVQLSPSSEHCTMSAELSKSGYTLREKLTRIFDKKHSKKSGRRAIRRWMAAVRESGLDCFDNFLTTLENRMDLITNYFISRSSSGWVEGLNNKIKVLKRRAYGIKNLGNLFRRIWVDLRAYEAFAH